MNQGVFLVPNLVVELYVEMSTTKKLVDTKPC